MGDDRWGSGARIPNSHLEHTIHDTNTLPAGTVAVRLDVTTAGVVVMTMGGVDISYSYPIGIHEEVGAYELVKSTSTTAVLSPVTKVVVKTVKG